MARVQLHDIVTSCMHGPGSPQPFYLHYGFTLTGEVKWGEDLLRLDLDAGLAGSAGPIERVGCRL